MPPYAPLPDCFGYSLFCDDVRYEVGNKTSYIGNYRGSMNFKGPYPLLLPKFIISVHFSQKIEVYVAPIVWIFLPGDSDDKPTLTQEFQRELPEVPAPGQEPSYISLESNIIFSPLIIQKEGAIKVRILRDGELHRIGTLFVSNNAPVSDET